VALLTGAELLMTRDAVASETPAARATSVRVGGGPPWVVELAPVSDIRHPG
jgi:hypothetical protein